MRLQRIRLEQLRQFRQPLEIDGLEPGLNLIVGPNESGKSTLAEAIRAAFFERHGSSALGHLQPWGDSGAAPEVEIDFVSQGRHWALKKRFLRRSRCDLQVDGQTFAGEQAEQQLAELLGYSYASRGASRPNQQGIPGLLWVQQGQSQDIAEPVAAAQSQLQSALGEAMGEIASSSGDALIQRVEAQRAELLTPTGQPRGSLREAQERLVAQQAELDELQARIAQYRDEVDRLGQLQQAQRASAADPPWLALRAQADQAQAALDRVEQQKTELAHARHSLQAVQQQCQLYDQQLHDLNELHSQLQQRQQALAQASEHLHALQARQPGLQGSLEQAQQAHQQAQAELSRARSQSQRQRLRAEWQQLQADLAEHQQRLAQASQLQQALAEQARELQAQAVDADALARLRQLDTRLQGLLAQQQAVATRLSWQLLEGQSVRLGAQELTGSGQTEVLQDSPIDIPGVGRLQLHPGGRDTGELQRELDKTRQEHAHTLHALKAADLSEAEDRARRQHALQTRLDSDQARLDTLAPKGLEALRQHVQLGQQRLDALAQELPGLGAPQASDGAAPPLDIAQAESQEAIAAQALHAAEQALTEQRHQHALAEQQQAQARREAEQLQARADAPDRAQRQQQAQAQLQALQAEQQVMEARLAELEHAIDAARPDILRQDVQRLRQSADGLQRQAAERERSMHALQARLDTLGAQGLEEQAAELARQVEQQQRHGAGLARHAEALDLLLRLLREQRQHSLQKLQQPLQKHLQHYLQLLFPGAALALDEQLVPVALTRHGTQAGELPELSYGAREQTGLIARLAYADLLREAGQPTLLILDDALVHSDTDRLEAMKRMLFDAATRHQILLLSCHPQRWQDLGVTARDLRSMSLPH